MFHAFKDLVISEFEGINHRIINTQFSYVLEHISIHFSLHEAMPHVTKQLQQLWGIKMIRLLFEPLFSYSDLHATPSSSSVQAKNKQSMSTFTNMTTRNKIRNI